MQTIKVYTLFDITNTEVIRNYKPILVKNHPTITTEPEWIKARHQQNNFETLLQVLSLRAQPTITVKPKKSNHYLKKFNIRKKGHIWSFEFTVDFDAVYSDFSNELGLLEQDCDRVPMNINLEETTTDEYLQVNKNIKFEIIKNGI